MPSPEQRSWVERGAEFSKKVDIVTGVVGVLMMNAPLVALSVLGYLAGDIVQNKFKKEKFA